MVDVPDNTIWLFEVVSGRTEIYVTSEWLYHTSERSERGVILPLRELHKFRSEASCLRITIISPLMRVAALNIKSNPSHACRSVEYHF